MARRRSDRGGTWAIVLAGGEGERVRPLVQRWLGRHRPKQYCTFTGTRSMFQHTVDRASALVRPQQIVTVAAPAHRAELMQQLADRPVGATLFQPENRDTAAGIFLPLAYIRALDPDATVLILPSDHFIHPEERFLETAKQMTVVTRQLRDRVMLLAVAPDRPEVEYGWIAPGRKFASCRTLLVRGIRRFIEKPAEPQAIEAMAVGALWNTLVLTANVETLWTLGWRCFPDMMPLFEDVERRVAVSGDAPALDDVYARMPQRNFSSGLLAQVPDRVAVVEAEGFLWCDWGKPERIVDTLVAIGRTPTFPPGLIAAANGGVLAHSRPVATPALGLALSAS